MTVNECVESRNASSQIQMTSLDERQMRELNIAIQDGYSVYVEGQPSNIDEVKIEYYFFEIDDSEKAIYLSPKVTYSNPLGYEQITLY